MTSIQEQLARTQRFVDLQAKARDLMMRVMPGVVNDQAVASLQAIVVETEKIAASASPDDQLTPRRMVEEFAADMTEWTARAHDSMHHVGPALDYYQRASRLYAQLGNAVAVRRIEDKSAELRLHAGQNIDAEFKRLLARLQEVAPGTLEEARTLVSLGELASLAGDDHGAQKWLLRAEQILDTEPFRLPDASSTLSALAGSLAAIQSGTVAIGPSPIENAMALRAVHQRLLFALSNAYRTANPQKSAEYGARVEQMDADRSSAGSRQALVDLMKKLID